MKEADASEPDGYYDMQEQAIDAGRELARTNNVSLVIHGKDGKVRDSEDLGMS